MKTKSFLLMSLLALVICSCSKTNWQDATIDLTKVDYSMNVEQFLSKSKKIESNSDLTQILTSLGGDKVVSFYGKKQIYDKGVDTLKQKGHFSASEFGVTEVGPMFSKYPTRIKFGEKFFKSYMFLATKKNELMGIFVNNTEATKDSAKVFVESLNKCFGTPQIKQDSVNHTQNYVWNSNKQLIKMIVTPPNQEKFAEGINPDGSHSGSSISALYYQYSLYFTLKKYDDQINRLNPIDDNWKAYQSIK